MIVAFAWGLLIWLVLFLAFGPGMFKVIDSRGEPVREENLPVELRVAETSSASKGVAS